MSKSHERQEEQHGGMGMGGRGVSRPMVEQQVSQHHQKHQQHEEEKGEHEQHEHGDHEEHGHGGHHMSEEDRLEMLKMHHKHTLWVYWTIIMLGCWLLVAPFSFGYLNAELWVDPSGGRGVWFSHQAHTALRAQLMTWSDVLCGLVLLILGWRSLSPNRPISLWACCFVGVWLTMAPVLFWAPTAAAYLNDTLVGAWLIGLTILVPGMPNMIMYMQMGDPQPPGWSYNPSSWPQRWIMIATGFAGWLVSRYLAMFQLGYINYVWDPFFGFSANTAKVLNSKMSHTWPISDAGLGGISYTFEFLMGFMGSPARWRTMPWMVAFFGVLVIPLGLTHIILVISQPVVVGHWCTMCLLAAAIMLPMIPLEVDEVIAMFQHLF
ncbi:MAG: vitamin K epoxide reductase family protein, partial [Planctomycetes bacterium]|nr:vitamin K epoxide reductase family protein [Planctomycetota bacterium]